MTTNDVSQLHRFRKKPVVISARRLDSACSIHTLAGTMFGNAGDWLIIGIDGEKYPCKHDIFVQTYEAADGDALLYFLKVDSG